MLEVKCPHCREANVYALTVTTTHQEVVCTVCHKTFFVSHDDTLVQDTESTSRVIAEEQDQHQLVVTAVIAFFPALTATGLIVTPLALLFDHLEVTGRFTLPDSLVAPTVIVIAGLFFFLWKVSASYVERRWFASRQAEGIKREEQEMKQ